MAYLKWVGGKQQLMSKIVEMLPDMNKIDNYFEPFIGGGSVFFSLYGNGHLKNKDIHISDINSDLVNCYIVLRDNLKELIQILDVLESQHNEKFYYTIRDWYNKVRKNNIICENIKKAACFIYLNKSCFNGLMRYNSEGEFNSPFGDKEKVNTYDLEELQKCSDMLNDKRVSIDIRSFEAIIDIIKNKQLKNCFVYMDPPYDNIQGIDDKKNKNFKGYDKEGFSARRFLRQVFNELNEMNNKVMLSDAPSPMIMEEFKKYNINIVKAKRMINSDATGRGEIDEVIIMNYEPPKHQFTLFDY